ncbi:vinorine synthase-like [Salvia splendens]|uniref:vinorine synthase-like n=1 Tax=Salvia splendens TaxID=180675 RepID=UPI001C257422|nr:vinorine synthase-like [Salvia splendens]
MEIETKLISIKTIKPSSPTPKSLQKYQLSFLDQLAFTTFIPFVYFYTPNPNFSKSLKSNQLKKSLSEALSIYYPLAGRLVGNLYVECNDAGFAFIEGEADCDVSQFIADPNDKSLEKFLPQNKTKEFHNLFLAVRVTYFRCGGVGVGIVLSHKIVDGLSSLSFVNTWSALARGGGGDATLPNFDVAYAPPLDILSFEPPVMELATEEVICKFITFSASEIASLQER